MIFSGKVNNDILFWYYAEIAKLQNYVILSSRDYPIVSGVDWRSQPIGTNLRESFFV